ncbi:MAG: gamma-glutamyltransferase [Cyanobacteria bacterium P01_E01_bin.34]
MTVSQRGAIAAGHPQTVEAGLEMFRLGGNAFDAAIAAMFASWVTEPALTSPGGGGFCLAHTQSGDDILFDFFTQTPKVKRTPAESDFYPIIVDFGGVQQEFHIGLGSIATPGSLDGAIHIHKRLGRLPLAEVAAPAIEFARYGVSVSTFQHYVLELLEPILTTSPHMQPVYAPQGQLLGVGDTCVMTDFANTLEFLVTEGTIAFREGDIAKLVVRDCQDRGGHLTLDDLRHYRTIERQPLAVNYRGRMLLSNPPPSFGGTLIAFCLKLLERLEMRSLDFGSQAHLEVLATVMRQTDLARRDRLNRHIQRDGIAAEFLASELLDIYAAGMASRASKLGSTTHISALDNDGNAASITASNGEGSSYTIPNTGIMLNNMLGEDDLNPDGFHRWPEDVRMSSMMAPSMMLAGEGLNHGKPETVLGSGGSKRIRTAIAQVISNLVDFGMSVEQAVSSPRMHWDEGKLNVEPGFAGISPEALGDMLGARIVQWNKQNMFFGGVNTVARSGNGQFFGAGDGRREGCADWV